MNKWRLAERVAHFPAERAVLLGPEGGRGGNFPPNASSCPRIHAVVANRASFRELVAIFPPDASSGIGRLSRCRHFPAENAILLGHWACGRRLSRQTRVLAWCGSQGHDPLSRRSRVLVKVGRWSAIFPPNTSHAPAQTAAPSPSRGPRPAPPTDASGTSPRIVCRRCGCGQTMRLWPPHTQMMRLLR